MDWLALLKDFLALVPSVAFAAPLIALVVDLLKYVKLPDGYGGLVALGLNVAFYIAVGAFGQEAVQPWVNLLAPILSALLGLLGSDIVHKLGVKFELFPFKSH